MLDKITYTPSFVKEPEKVFKTLWDGLARSAEEAHPGAINAATCLCRRRTAKAQASSRTCLRCGRRRSWASSAMLAEIKEMKQQVQNLVASHAARVRAVMQHGRMQAWQKFWRDYQPIAQSLNAIGAIPPDAQVIQIGGAREPRSAPESDG